MSTTPFPQYARTDHPAVLEAVQQTLADYRAFRAQCAALAEQLTGHRDAAITRGWAFDLCRLIGFKAHRVDPKRVQGKWTTPKQGLTRPHKSSALHARMSQVSHLAATIPGRGNILWGENQFHTGAIFVHGGQVYSGLEFTPAQPARADMDDYGWVVIPEANFHDVMEHARAAATEAPTVS